MKHLKKMIQYITGRKMNNHGSTLLTVIICIAFISILGSLILSVTMTNLQMKLIESKSKKNFYSCETIMEKIRTAAQEAASGAVRYVYENEVLKNYATYLNKSSESERNAAIKELVVAEFVIAIDKDSNDDAERADYSTVLAKASTDGYDITDPDDLTKANYFLTNAYLTTEENSMVTFSKLTCPTDYTKIILNNVKIEYESADGYRSAIASDIVITLPQFSFTSGTQQVVYRMAQPYQQFVLAADGTITSDNTSPGTTGILGNVYSGTGIHIFGQNLSTTHQVNIDGSTVISGGDITVSDAATLNIGSATSKPVIWADNLATNTSPAYVASAVTYPTTLNIINGISVIKDDLTLNARKSSVNMKGAYIGYTGAHDSSGSSIIINGSDSSMDLSGLVDLILAGRANVTVDELALARDTDIMTGESIAFKSNQRAYLMPAAFLKNVEHNPVTDEDSTPDVQIDNPLGDITYNDYVASPSYKIAAKQTGTTLLRYYYVNFASGKQADSFMLKFFTNHSDILKNMAPLNLGTVKLPNEADTFAVGNLMSYNSLNGDLQLVSGKSSLNIYPNDAALETEVAGLTLNNSRDPVYTSTVLQDKKVGQLNGLFSMINHLLSLDSTRTYDDTTAAIAATIRPGAVNQIVNDSTLTSSPLIYRQQDLVNPVVFNDTDPNAKHIWIINGNVNIADSADSSTAKVFNGIMIATGNITIGNNAKINGLIVSTGELSGAGNIIVGNNVQLNGRFVTTKNIILGQNCTLATNSAAETAIDDLFHSENQILGKIFRGNDLIVDYTINNQASSLVDLSSMVTYENWRRTE